MRIKTAMGSIRARIADRRILTAWYIVAAAFVAFGIIVLDIGIGETSTHDVLEFIGLGLLLLASMIMLWSHYLARQEVAVDLALPEHVRMMVRDTFHELRTPITIARGHAELLSQVSRPGTDSSDVDVVLGELDRLSRLTDRLLILAAATDPQFLVHEAVDLEELVVGLAGRWSRTVVRRWKVSVQDSHVILADGTKLLSALDALIENAVHHTVETDQIAIDAAVLVGLVRIDVSDSGAGISAGRLSQLFQDGPDQGPISLRRPGGTGLGLPIVKAIAEAHGGWVSVTSREGVGSTFSVLFPAASPTGAQLGSDGIPGQGRP
jgi:signal transduction histidine kinase